jgi:hypothetical protein
MHANEDNQEKDNQRTDFDDQRQAVGRPDHYEKDLHQGEAESLYTADVADLPGGIKPEQVTELIILSSQVAALFIRIKFALPCSPCLILATV